jgi:hypothetical protein
MSKFKVFILDLRNENEVLKAIVKKLRNNPKMLRKLLSV